MSDHNQNKLNAILHLRRHAFYLYVKGLMFCYLSVEYLRISWKMCMSFF